MKFILSILLLVPSISYAQFIGPRMTLFVAVNFADDPRMELNLQEVPSLLAQDFLPYTIEASYGLSIPTVTVYPNWITVSSPPSTYFCMAPYWYVSQADTQLSAEIKAEFPHRIYYFNARACGWGGQASGGEFSSIVIMNGRLGSTLIHEYGHGYGFRHTASLSCNTSGCTFVEYGDDSDIMSHHIGHFGPGLKNSAGWLPKQNVTQSGTYSIGAYSSPIEALPKALEFTLAPNFDGTGRRLYVINRTDYGWDWPANNGIAMYLHEDGGTIGNTQYQLDMKPLTDEFGSRLGISEEFTFEGITIRVLDRNESGAELLVTMDTIPAPQAASNIRVK